MSYIKKSSRTKLTTGAIAIALLLSGFCLHAQETKAVSMDDLPTRTIYLTNSSERQEGNEIVTAVRNLVSPRSKIFFVPSQNAIIVRSDPNDLALAEKLINDLDRPNKTYRLTYTFTEMDNGKSIGTQHYGLIVVSGERTTLKQGNRVPVVVGSGASGAPPQVTYIDVGMNFDVTLDEFANGVRLRSRVEQSSAEQTSGATPRDPVIRQTTLEGTAFLNPGKPMILGSLDIPGSTRHMDVAVEMEAIK